VKLEIFRMEQPAFHTIGAMRLDGKFFCATLEPPWRDNKPFLSCIPCGCYKAVRVHSPRFGVTWEITDVEGRSLILFHPGNWTEDTAGCVLLGQYPNKLKSHRRAVLNSGATFQRFMDLTSAVDELDVFIVSV
jgi:hypothetical protein